MNVAMIISKRLAKFSIIYFILSDFQKLEDKNRGLKINVAF